MELPGGIADEVSTRNTGRELLTLGPDTVQAVIDRGMEQDAGTTAQKFQRSFPRSRRRGSDPRMPWVGSTEMWLSTVGERRRRHTGA